MAGNYKFNDKRERLSTSKSNKDLNPNDLLFKSGKTTMKSFLHDLSPTTRLGVIPPPEIKLHVQSCRNKVPMYSSGKVFKCQNNKFQNHKKGRDVTCTNNGSFRTMGMVSKKLRNQSNQNKASPHYNMSSVYKELTADSKTRTELLKSCIKKSSVAPVEAGLTKTQRAKSAIGRLESHDINVSLDNAQNTKVKSMGIVCKNDSGKVSKHLLRRPSSSVTTKQESKEYCEKWQDRSKCDQVERNTFLQEKQLKTSKVRITEPIPKSKPLPVNIDFDPLERIHEPIKKAKPLPVSMEPEFKLDFNVQGCTISRPSSGVLKKDDKMGKSLYTGIMDEKLNQMNKQDDSIIIDAVEEVDLIENNSACFLTEMLDSPRDFAENMGDSSIELGNEELLKSCIVKAWGNSVNEDKTEDTCGSTNTQESSYEHVRELKKSESVTTSVITLELEENSERTDDLKMADTFPYKLDFQPVCTDDVISEEKVINTYMGRQLPQSLGAIVDFMCKLEDSKKLHHLTGMGPENCLMFIPDIDCYEMDTLNEVPSIQHVDDDLPYIRVVSPVHKVPKKLLHLSKPRTVPKWQNRYSSASLHKTRGFEPKRTISTVRKGTSHLDNVLKDVACDGNQSVVLKFQADIERLRSTVKTTLGKVPTSSEIPSSHEPPDLDDHFELRKFYRERYVEADKLRKQVSCVEEFAKLEIGTELPGPSEKLLKQTCVAENDGLNNVQTQKPDG